MSLFITFILHKKHDTRAHKRIIKGMPQSTVKQTAEERVIGMEGRNEMFYLTMHSTHFIYSYLASDIW